MKKYIRLILLSCLILIGSFLIYKIWNTTKVKASVSDAIQKLPSLMLTKLDGTSINTDSLRNNGQIIILNYFNPDCDHCQSMAKELKKDTTIIENICWLMVTSEGVEKTFRFVDSFQLQSISFLTVISDTSYLFQKAFGAVSVPSFFVYKNGSLYRKHSGECSIPYLLK